MRADRMGSDPRSRQQQNKRMAMSRKRAANGNGGKGDWDRTTDRTKFRLGMELIRIAEEFGKDSPEYKRAEKAWRKAQ